jgi:hypothetical protein
MRGAGVEARRLAIVQAGSGKGIIGPFPADFRKRRDNDVAQNAALNIAATRALLR